MLGEAKEIFRDGDVVSDIFDENKKYIYDGSIWREDGKVIVEAKGDPSCVKYGAVCINPDASDDDKIYRKVFEKKPIFLFSE